MLATRLLLLSLVCAAGAEFRTKPLTRGSVTAEIEIRIADKPVEQGIAEVTLIISLEGPAGLKMLRVDLIDTVSGWEQEGKPSYSETDGLKKKCREVIKMKQAKSGRVSLPGVKVRFRESPNAGEETVEWPDLLRLVQVQLEPVEVPVQPVTVGFWRQCAAVILTVTNLMITALAVWILRPRRRPQGAPFTPEQRAARELTAAEALLATDFAAAHERMADIVRGLLAERLQMSATHRTTAEFLKAIGKEAPVPEALREFCERCDLVKFAGVRPSAEECRRTVELAFVACGLATPFAKRQAVTPAATAPTPAR